MKKILAFTLSVILAGTALTGCGNSEKKVEKLCSIASTILKAGNSAFMDLDKEDIYIDSTFYLDSEGEIFGNYDGEYIDEFLETYRLFFDALDDYYWIIGINTEEHSRGNEVTEVYLTESKDSDVIGAYANHFDVSGKSVIDLKNEISDWIDKNNSLGMTVEEFEKEYNKIVPLSFDNDEMTISKTKTDVEETYTITEYKINYTIDGETIRFNIHSNNDNGYIERFNILSNVSIEYWVLVDKENNTDNSMKFLEMLLSPYLVLNNNSDFSGLLNLRGSLEPKEALETEGTNYISSILAITYEDEDIDSDDYCFFEGTDEKFTYTLCTVSTKMLSLLYIAKNK